MPEEDGSSRGAPAARAKGGSPGPKEDDGPPLAPATASVMQLKGMVPKSRLPVSLEAMDEAVARAVARRPG